METLLHNIFMSPKLYFGIAAFLYDLLLSLFVSTKYSMGRKGRRFALFVVFVTFASFIEILRPAVGDLADTPAIVWLKRVIQSINYICSTGMAFTFAWYLDSFFKSNSRLRFVFRRINLGLYLLFAAIMLANIFTGWVAGYDEATQGWTRGPLYLAVGYSFALYYLAYAVLFFLRDLRRMEKRVLLTMVASITIAVLSVVCQPLLHDSVRLMVFGVSLAVYLWFFSVENFDTRRLIAVTKELQTAEQKALEASLAKNAFLANMSHEIRTPMNAVLGFDEMILKSNDKAEIDEYARNIQSAGKTLLSIINDILDFSKIETGRLEFVTAPYHLGTLVEDVERMIAVRAQQKGIGFEVELDDGLPDNLVGDEIRVRQIMLNLLNNGIKYTERGFVRLTVGGAQVDGTLTLKVSVRDSGVGIKEEDMGHLFQSFERLDETRHHSVEGTGLGLAIVKQLLDLMGGDISVKSEFGKGSEFSFSLPQSITSYETIAQVRQKRQVESRQLADSAAEKITAPSAKVLIVDDNRVNLMVAKGLLKDTQVQIVLCESGKKCLELMQQDVFDVIFLDHMMPEMDGVQTLQQSHSLERNLNRNTPVVALTANAMSGMKEQYLAAGFADYISKPVDGQRLTQVLFRHVPKGKQIVQGEANTAPAAQKEPPVHQGLIDRTLGMELCGGTPELYQSVLALFAEDKEQNVGRLNALFAAGNWGDYAIIAHALKSSSKIVGCQSFSDFALKMEKASLDGDPFAAQNHERFVAAYEELVVAVQQEHDALARENEG